MKRLVLLLTILAWFSVLIAQQSGSYRLEEHEFATVMPESGSVNSSSFELSRVSIGTLSNSFSSTSASYNLNAGFLAAYPAPGEVVDLVFADRASLSWTPEYSAGTYSLYGNTLASLPALGFGNCLAFGIQIASTPVEEDPPAGEGFFYLVAVRNRLGEEGTLGSGSDGTQRTNGTPCE